MRVDYYDEKGEVHTVETKYNGVQHTIKLDGKYYGSADDRIELDDAIKELVEYMGFTVKRPAKKRAKKKTSLQRLAAHSDV